MQQYLEQARTAVPSGHQLLVTYTDPAGQVIVVNDIVYEYETNLAILSGWDEMGQPCVLLSHIETLQLVLRTETMVAEEEPEKPMGFKAFIVKGQP